MTTPRRTILSTFAVYGCAAFGIALHGQSKRMNVLHVIFDDLRAETKEGLTPNLEKLMGDGVYFPKAYVNQAICGPSRNSFLSGRKPDRTRSWTFTSSFRHTLGYDAVSLPQSFMQAGYRACGVGKTYHDDFKFQPHDYDTYNSDMQRYQGWSPECGEYYVPIRDTCPWEEAANLPGFSSPTPAPTPEEKPMHRSSWMLRMFT
jgi:arylsulfatase A-like enzyme